jgi:hypothetical protein
MANRLQETFTVLVNLFNSQRSHRQTQLAEDNLFTHIFDFVLRQVQDTLGSIGHNIRSRTDTDRKRARHMNTDVLQRKRIFKWNVNGDWRQAQIRVILYQRPDKRTAAVHRAA